MGSGAKKKGACTSLPSPPLLFIAIFPSHRSVLSERLEQARPKLVLKETEAKVTTPAAWWKRPRLAKGIGSNCENDWHKSQRVTERKRIQVLLLQERNFYLIFIHFKQCVLYLYDYKRLFYTDSETKLAPFPFPRFLLQEVHWIFLCFPWVCTRLPPFQMALCECNRKTALSTFQFPFSITRRECLLNCLKMMPWTEDNDIK